MLVPVVDVAAAVADVVDPSGAASATANDPSSAAADAAGGAAHSLTC